MRRLFILLIFTLSFSYGQSLWIETGLDWLEQIDNPDERPNQVYDEGFKVGARVIFPIASSSIGIYLAPYLRFDRKVEADVPKIETNLGVDTGAWFTLPLNIQDVEGFTSYIGTGVSIAALAANDMRFGIAVSGAITYDLNDSIALALVYTHRPLFTPRLSQGFDVSIGIGFDVGN